MLGWGKPCNQAALRFSLLVFKWLYKLLFILPNLLSDPARCSWYFWFNSWCLFYLLVFELFLLVILLGIIFFRISLYFWFDSLYLLYLLVADLLLLVVLLGEPTRLCC